MFQYKIVELIKGERGSVLIIVGFSIFMLLAAAGVAIDTSRYIIARNKMVTALDSATIAAATVAESAPDLNLVGQNYFDANFSAGNGGSSFMDTVMNPVVITHDAATGVTTGTVTGVINNTFMKIFGFSDISLNSYSEIVKEQVADIEIVLALDNSPSMCPPSYKFPPNWTGTAKWNNSQCIKFNAVHAAASNFLDVLFNSPNIINKYVGIVPFAHNVNSSGRQVPASFAVENTDFNSPLIAPMQGLTSDKKVALNALDAMFAQGQQWTRVNVGANAAWLMLRPDHKRSFNHENASLPGDKTLDPDLNKIVVLMTDGENITYGRCTTPFGSPLGCKPEFISAAQHNYRDGSNDDEDLRTRCDAMKADGIIIYTVLVNVRESVSSSPASIEGIFRDHCATAPAAPFYHNIDCGSGVFDAACTQDLISAYEAIALSLSKIRINK